MTEHAQLEQAQRYAAQLLDHGAAAEFEDHLLGCERCQAEVKLAVGLKRMMSETPQVQPIALRRHRWFMGTAGMLVAATLILAVVIGRMDRGISELGQVTEPPAYEPMAVRAVRQQGDSLFALAMTAYVGGRYQEAATRLRAALAAGADTLRASFFMASAELMAGNPGAAIDPYARVIAMGVPASAYLGEARLYRARALLQLERADEALAELAAIAPDDPRRAAADSLAASVTKVRQR